jgi:hypothetical protein
MNSKIMLLSIVLVAQLLLVGGIYFGDSRNEIESSTWLEFDTETIDGLKISGPEGSVLLSRSDGDWMLEELPADQSKVTSMLSKLEAMQAPWPVANSAESAQRFEVSESNYQREVRLLNGEEVLAKLYLGTSPGYQRVHARRSSQDDIFSVALSNFELPTAVDGWMDKGLLAIDSDLESIVLRITETGENHSLVNSEEGWLYNDGAADQSTSATYAGRFKTLRVASVAEDSGEAVTVGVLDVKWVEGAKNLTILKLGEDYLVSDGSRKYGVATYVAEQLLLNDVSLAAQVDAESTNAKPD